MKKKTRLQELTLKNNFMFGAVMMEPENCRKLLEMALGSLRRKKYRYTFHIQCEESDATELDDGRSLIFLSTHGKNEDEVPRELITFLRFVKSDLRESHEDFQDTYVEQLQESVKQIKESREMEARFMILKEMLQEEHARGKAEGKIEGEAFGKAQAIISILSKLAPIPEEIHNRILGEQNLQILDEWLQAAISAESIDEFVNKIS